MYIPPGKKTGLVPRDYKSFPVGCHAYAPAFPSSELIPENEWAERLKEQQANKAGLLDLREANYDILKSLDQNGFGLCWAFSTTKAVMYLRALMNEPPEVLSAWYVAGMIKGWRDEGGWGAASLEFVVNSGIPTIDKCPKYSRNSATSDAAENAALHKVTEWYDGSDNPDEARAQFVSMSLKGIPGVLDFNSLGHSMCGVGVTDKYEPICDNSWNEISDFGPKGLYIVKGRAGAINGLVFPRVTNATTV